MIRYQITTLVCPQCNRRLARGFRRFGPAEVRCGHCGTPLRTGLDDWYAPFPFPGQGGRAGIVAAELLVPSWLGIRGFAGFVLHWLVLFPLILLVTGTVGAIPLFVIMAAAGAIAAAAGPSPSPLLSIAGATLITIGVLLALLGTLAYPIWLVLRLVRMVREAGEFKRTGVPPTWPKNGLAARGTPAAAPTPGATPGPAETRAAAREEEQVRRAYERMRKPLKTFGAMSGTTTSLMKAGDAVREMIRDPRSVVPLLRALQDADPDVRAGAASTLGRMADPRAVEPLIQALRDEGVYVRCAAARALAELKDLRAVEPLKQALQDENADVRSAAGAALEALGGAAH